MRYKTPETFIVGETVSCRNNGVLVDVKVLAVEGNVVKVVTYHGRPMIFHSRNSDGQHVGQFTEEFQAKPDIIFHKTSAAATPAKESFFTRVMNAFA